MWNELEVGGMCYVTCGCVMRRIECMHVIYANYTMCSVRLKGVRVITTLYCVGCSM